jgi:galacturonosyltransferase
MLKILVLSNAISGVYNLRKEFIDRLLVEGHEVAISTPGGVESSYFTRKGCRFIETPVSRRGTNIITDMKLLKQYRDIMKRERPDVVLTYTIKSNIYGGIAARLMGIPYMASITGLGSAVENGGILQKITLPLYRNALSRVSCVFFQNEDNLAFFQEKDLLSSPYRLVPGSGVNLDDFSPMAYPEGGPYQFLFIGRLIREKGVEEYFNAAEYIHAKYPDTMFHVLGPPDHRFGDRLGELEAQGVVKYHGYTQDMNAFYKIAHCIVHPTYYPEGMSNVLLESAACGRPVITTNRSGCREIVEEGRNGFFVEKANTADLIAKIESFIALPPEKKKAMGLAGRKLVEERFDRRIVVSSYLEEIREVEREIRQEQAAREEQVIIYHMHRSRMRRSGF